MLIEWIRRIAATLQVTLVQPPFLVGVCLGAGGVLLLCLLIMLLRYRHSRCSSIAIESACGSVLYSMNAIKSFVGYELSAYPVLHLKRLKIRRRGSKVAMTLYVTATSCVNFSAIYDELRQRILNSAASHFGLKDTIASIDIVLAKLEYDAPPSPDSPVTQPGAHQTEPPSLSVPDGDAAPLQPLQDK